MKARFPAMTPEEIKACIIKAADFRPVGVAPRPSEQVKVLDDKTIVLCM
jgi:hypothetical protein